MYYVNISYLKINVVCVMLTSIFYKINVVFCLSISLSKNWCCQCYIFFNINFHLESSLSLSLRTLESSLIVIITIISLQCLSLGCWLSLSSQVALNPNCGSIVVSTTPLHHCCELYRSIYSICRMKPLILWPTDRIRAYQSMISNGHWGPFLTLQRLNYFWRIWSDFPSAIKASIALSWNTSRPFTNTFHIPKCAFLYTWFLCMYYTLV